MLEFWEIGNITEKEYKPKYQWEMRIKGRDEIKGADMPRGPRLDALGTLHHVILWGIERHKIVDDDKDRENFVSKVIEHATKKIKHQVPDIELKKNLDIR